MVEVTDPKVMNGKPIRHEVLPPFRGLACDEKGRLGDAVPAIHYTCLDPSWVLVHALHCILPYEQWRGHLRDSQLVPFVPATT